MEGRHALSYCEGGAAGGIAIVTEPHDWNVHLRKEAGSSSIGTTAGIFR